jgi:hypothetical protein
MSHTFDMMTKPSFSAAQRRRVVTDAVAALLAR